MNNQNSIKDIRKNKLIEDFKSQNIDLNGLKRFISISFYSNKKVNLCYNKLQKPKIDFYLINSENHLIPINKTIYFYLNELQEDNINDFLNSIKNQYKDIFLRIENTLNKGFDYTHLLNNWAFRENKNEINLYKAIKENDLKNILECLK